MAKQYKILVNTGKAENNKVIDVPQRTGDRGQPIRIKAQAGNKYQLQELGKDQGKNTAPDYIRVQRKGKNLELTFEGGSSPDVIIEDYYSEMPAGYNGVIGQAENGSFYEYIPEDPNPRGLISELGDGAQPTSVVLGGDEVNPAGAAVALLAFNPLLGLLGAGAAAAVAADGNTGGGSTPTVTGALDAASDTGTLGDNRTNDKTPDISGKVAAGSTNVTVKIKDANGNVVYTANVTPNADGTYKFSVPTDLADGTYTPEVTATSNGTTTTTGGTPFTIDTVTNVAIADAGKVGTTNTISGTAEPGDTIVVKDANGNTIGTATANSSGQWSLTPTTALPSGNITATATDPASNTASATGTPATNSADGLKTALTIDPIAGDNIINALESGASNYTITGKVTGKFAAGDAVILSLNSKTFSALVTADGSYSVPVLMADLLADADTKIEATVKGTGGDNATAAQDYAVDTITPATKTALSVNAVTADNVLTAAENNGNITITGTVSGKFAAGDVVTLTITGKTFTGAAAANGSYSISVPAADLVADSDTLIDAAVTGTGGTLARAIQDYGVDLSNNNGSKTALTIDPITGDNVITATESGATQTTITGKVSGKFAAGDTVTLTLNSKPYTAGVAADGSYQIKVNTTDLSTDSDKKIEGTVTGTGGDVATAAQTYTVESSNVVTKTALIIDPVTADNVLSSNETGTIAITGKVTGKFAAGDTVTLTVNGKTFSGTVDAGGSYSIGVPAADLNADSDTQVDGTVTGTGGTTAVAIQNYALDGINPTPTPPVSLKTALSLSPVTGDNILSTAEQGATTTTLSGKVTGTFVAGDVVTLKINGTPYTASVAADGSYSVSVQTADLKADSDHKIDASVTGTNGSVASAAQSYVLEDNANVGKVTALTIDPVTADNIIGSAESAGSIAITGKVTGAFAVGDTVTLTVNGKTFSGTVVSGGTYSIPVPAADLLADADTTVDGKVIGTGGTAAVAMQDYGIDPNINPVPTPSVKTALTINPITGDNIINSAESGAASTVVTGKVTGTFAAGDVVTLLVNNKTYTGSAAADGSYNISVPTADLVADPDTKIEGSVTGGNGGQLASAAQDYVLDANSPSAPTKTALSIDPITADNMISDAENTGAISVTGTVTGKFAAGDKVTLTINGKPYTGVADAAGKFTIPVLASDLVADSDTQVDGTVTGTGGTLATALQNYGTSITNPAPVPVPSAKTAIAIDPITGDNILNSADQGTTTITVTGKVTGAFAAGDTVTLSLNGQGFTTTVSADGSFNKAIATSNFTADADTKIEGAVTGFGGSYATAAQDYTLDANAPTDPKQTALSIDKVTQDNIIGVSEATGSITLTGHVTGKFAAGDVVTLVINGHNYTGTAAADGSYSVAVPAYELINDPDTTVDGTVTGTGGTTAAATQNYGVDSNVPVNPTPGPVPVPSLKTALSIDAITGDNIVNAADAAQSTTTITGHVTGAYAAGDRVTLTLNGKDYTANVAANGSYSVSVATADLANDADSKIEGSVTGTNGSFATAAQDYELDSGNTPSKTALSIDPVTADNIIGSAETTGNINVTGKVTGAFSVGDQVTLTINGKTFQGTAAANGSYSIAVPAADLVADTDSTIDGTVRGTGGTTAAAIQNYGVDSSVNPVPPVDTTPPTIMVDRTHAGSTLTAGSTETITFTLSEASTNFDASDVTVTGGTLDNFVAVPTSGSAAAGYTQYTATFTPTAGSSGTATISVASGKFTDNAGNANRDTYLNPAPSGATYQADNQVSIGYNTIVNPAPDTVAPTVQVSIDKSTLASGQSATLTFILSEPSADFTLSDVTVISGGGTVSNLVAVPGSNGAQYTATYTAGSTTGTVQIGVGAGTFHDASGNANADTYVSGTGYEVNNFVNLTVTATDATAPTVAITRTGTGTVNASGETIVFTFSEGVTSASFTLADIDPVGGTMSNLAPVESSKTATGVYTQYTATFTPTSGATGVATVGILASKFSDATGNLNHDTYTNPATGTDVYEVNNQISFNYNASNNPADTTPPTIAISADKTTLAANGTATVTFTLSEASTDFTQSDVQVTGGTLSGWTQVNSTTYTATYTPTGGNMNIGSVHVDSNAFRDAASNYNTDGADANNTVIFIVNDNILPPDTTVPTIAITRLGSGTLSSAAGETIQFTLSEASKDFTLADIDVTGGTLVNLAAVPTSGTAGTGYTTYVATFIPSSNSTTSGTIGVLSHKFSDAAGNFNHDTYTNPATGNDVYEVNNLVTIPVNTVTPSNDTTPPTVAVARAGSGTLNAGGTDTITFTLSEPSLTFDQSDVTVSGGSLSGWTMVAASGTPTTGYAIYTAVFTPTATSTGTATIGVQSDKFQDAAGNLNKDTYLSGVAGTTQEANNQISIGYDTTTPTHDTTPPTVEVVRSATGTITGPETIYFNFSEATTDFALTDITVSGGTMSNLVVVTGSGNKQYIATFTPNATSTGTAAIGVKAGTFSDAAGNFNKDTFDTNDTTTGAIVETNNQVSAAFDTTHNPVVDTTAPTVAISRVGTGAVTGAGETLVFVFSEPVSNFALTDIVDTSTGNAASGISNLVAVAGSNNTQFTATYTPPTGSVGAITLGIKAGSFNDAAGNNNLDTYSASADSVSGHVVEANNQLVLIWNTDTTAPTIAVSSSVTSLTSGTATITFTLSETGVDFTQSDVVVTGGTLSNFQQTTTNPLVYTATFTPNSNSTGTATIGVHANAFKDLAGNANTDDYSLTGAENTNNKVDIAYDTRSAIFGVTNDTAAVTEDTNTVAVPNPVTGNVLTNDNQATTVTAVGAGTASGSSANVGTSLSGTYGTLTLNANGTYTYTLDNTKASVQALKAGATVNDIFTYTARDSGSTSTGSANLVITITGTNDAPVVSVPLVSQTATIGTAMSYAFDSGTFTDVDAGDTATYSAQLVDSSGTLVNGGTLPTWLTFNASTRTFSGTPPTGSAGTIYLKVTDTDGSNATANGIFSITVNNATPPSSNVVAANDAATAVEAGGSANATAGTNLNVAAANGVLANDTGTSLTVSAVAHGSTTGTVGSDLHGTYGTYGTLHLNRDGSYTYVVDDDNATVQALRTSGQSVTDSFSYTITDGTNTSTATLSVNVLGANDAPVYTTGSLANQSITAGGTALNYQFSATAFSDVDSTTNGETATYTATLSDGSPLPTWLQFNAATRTFSGTPPANTPAGTITVKVTDTDAGGLTANGTFNIVINAGNTNSTATIDITSIVDSATSSSDTGTSATDFVTSDPTLTYKGTVTGWVAGLGDRVMLELIDTNTGLASTAFVTPASDGTWSWNDTSTSRDDGTHILKATIVSATGTTALNVTAPTNGTGGGYDVQAIVIDSRANNTDVNLGVSITTDTNNDALVNTTELNGATTFTSRATFNSNAKVGDKITFHATNDGAALTDVTVTLTDTDIGNRWVETTFSKPADGKVQVVTANYTDLAGNTATDAKPTDSATLNTNVAQAPVGVNDTASATEAGGTANGTAGTDVTKTATEGVLSNDTDANGDALSVQDIKAGSGSATAVSAGTTSATGTTVTGSYGTLKIGADGSYTYVVDQANATVQELNTGGSVSDVFTYTVKDPSGLTSTATLTVAVNGANDAPVANAIADTTGTEGMAFSYSVASNFTDVDNDSLTYSATLANDSPLPSWLSFNASTRTFSGTPPAGAAGTTVSVKVTASDGALSANDTYDIVIGSANHAPTVTQTTATADPLGAATAVYSSFTAGSTLNGSSITGNGTFTFGSTTATVTGSTGASTNNTNGTQGLWLGDQSTSGAIVDETATVTFSKAVSQVKITYYALNWDTSGAGGTGPKENLVIYINGQHYSISPSEISGAQPVTINANGDVQGSDTNVNVDRVITINAVPGSAGITSVAVKNQTIESAAGSIVSISATENTSIASGYVTASATVQTLFGSYYADSDSGDLMRGVMVSGVGGSAAQTALGKYQYSHDGGTTWVDIAASVSESSALYLAKTDLVRFVPSASNTTGAKPDLTVHVVDSHSGNPTYTVGTSYDTTGANSGGSTSISGGTFTLMGPTMSIAASVSALNKSINFSTATATNENPQLFRDGTTLVGFDSANGSSLQAGDVITTSSLKITSLDIDTVTSTTANNMKLDSSQYGLGNGNLDWAVLLGYDNAQSTPGAYKFESKVGLFKTVSFKHSDLQRTTFIEFFDANGNSLGAAVEVAGGGAYDGTSASIKTFNGTVPNGASAAYFVITTTRDAWSIDTIVLGNTADQNLTDGSNTVDTTPTLTGTVSVAVTAGQKVQVFEGSTLLGEATLDTARTTWTFTPTTAQTAGTHTYTAKVVDTATGNTVIASSNYSLTINASPLVLDLNGDGVQTMALANGTQFDIDADGKVDAVGWASQQDGLLAIDLNGDGKINSGAELFGNHTLLTDGTRAADGWAALAALDSNADGKIDAQDAAFAQLRVWQDANGDGLSDAGELRSLTDRGIVSIDLHADATSVAQNGNVLQGFSSFTTADGAQHAVADAWLDVRQSEVITLAHGESLDLSALLASGSKFVAGVDMSQDSAANVVKLSLADLLTHPAGATHQLKLTGDSNDTVQLDLANWTNTGTTVTDNGHTYAVYNANALSSEQLLIDQHMLVTQHS